MLKFSMSCACNQLVTELDSYGYATIEAILGFAIARIFFGDLFAPPRKLLFFSELIKIFPNHPNISLWAIRWMAA